MIEAIGGLLFGCGLSILAVNWMFRQGIYVKAGRYSGYACQYPGSSVRLYGKKEIAVLNHHPEQGDRLFRVVEVDED